MNQNELKLLLVRDKVFLKRLYDGPNYLKNKTVLETAEDNELNTVIKYLHFVSNGKITITKSNFQEILKSKKLNYIRNNVEKESNMIKTLNLSRKKKLNFLLKLATVMPYLLYGLFNLK